MWIVAGALLVGFALMAVLGALTAPHAHLVAVLAGLAAAVVLGLLVAAGSRAGVAWALLGVDIAAIGVVGVSATRALRAPRHPKSSGHRPSLVGAEGVAVGPLDPDGVVKVRGEQWSATSLNGPVRAGAKVQVVAIDQLKLEVWNEEAP